MFFIIVRLALIAIIIWGVVYFIKLLIPPSDFKKCGRCEGKGFWYAARGKEKCDWCNGSGKLPK